MNTERFFGYPIAPIVQNILKYKKSGSVLDLGSGSGRHTLYLAEKRFKIEAIDSNQSKLLELRRNAKRLHLHIKTRKANITTHKIRKKYDVIMAIMSLHFLKKQQVDEVIARMKNHTNAGGLNIIGVLTSKQPKGYRPYLFSKNELRKYYADWKVLEYEEKLSRSYIRLTTGKQERQHRALIIARKS